MWFWLLWNFGYTKWCTSMGSNWPRVSNTHQSRTESMEIHSGWMCLASGHHALYHVLLIWTCGCFLSWRMMEWNIGNTFFCTLITACMCQYIQKILCERNWVVTLPWKRRISDCPKYILGGMSGKSSCTLVSHVGHLACCSMCDKQWETLNSTWKTNRRPGIRVFEFLPMPLLRCRPCTMPSWIWHQSWHCHMHFTSSP